ncbi:hypothetical protein PVK06_023944 [Gossypium arboreum]|uniref:Uncharacterized protein n=1 Tax=Gossypium arboreum TaxID=29729 RepID=A0ABR0PCK9_GOSAR|nr:hypothetical protein PVK06_023944 [Gossypium arboreum]
MTSIEQSLKPSRSIIKDTLFQQYIKPWAKQIKDGNKQWLANMDQEEEAHESEKEREEEGDDEHEELEDEEDD